MNCRMMVVKHGTEQNEVGYGEISGVGKNAGKLQIFRISLEGCTSYVERWLFLQKIIELLNVLNL